MADTKKAINFLAKDGLDKSPIGKIFKWVLGVGRVIIMVTEVVAISTFLLRFKLDSNLTALNEEIAKKQLVVSASQELENNVRFLQKQLFAINLIELQDLRSTTVLNALSQITPLDVTLSNLQINKTNISLTAESLSSAGLATFLKGLKTSEYFSQIDLTSVESPGANNPILRFQLSAKLKN